MDMRALFEMETHTFCPAREHQEYPNRDGRKEMEQVKEKQPSLLRFSFQKHE